MILLLAMVMVMTLAALPSASAKVHVITPLIKLSCVVSPNAGGNGTTGTPADLAIGGPIAGPIPNATGNAHLPTGEDNPAFNAPVEVCAEQ